MALLDVRGLCCDDEKILLEKKVAALRGVSNYDVNLLTQRMRVAYDPARVSLQDIIRSVSETGMKAFVTGDRAQVRYEWWRERRIHLLVLSAVLTAGAYLGSLSGLPENLAHALYLAAVVAGGYYPVKAGLSAARTLSMNINTLLILGVVGALGLDLWEEAAILVIVYSLGNVLETMVVTKARGAIKSFMDLMPREATVRDGQIERTVPTADLRIGDIVIVRPGEKIPMDGTVYSGESFVDESAVTGEPMPVRKTRDEMVFAGTLNQNGSLSIRVTKKAEDTTLARIIHSVEEAEAKKSSFQLFGEKFARTYTPIMFFLGTGVALLPPLLFQGEWHSWIYRGLVVFVVSCSCGLALSVPVAVVAAVGSAARRGILFKGGLYLERTAGIKVVAFDKTGTLTIGRPAVTELTTNNGLSERDVLSLAASIEALSEHPIAEAIVRRARELDVLRSRNVEGFEAIPGRGVRASVGGREYLMGNQKLFEENGYPLQGIEKRVQELEEDGHTVVIIGDREQNCGFFGISDMLKTDAKESVNRLKELGVGVVMLTGDTEGTAGAIARELGIEHHRSGLMPQDKIDAVSELRTRIGPTMMIGDGINDSPAMAISDVGVAMGAAGTDVAMETGDVVLMADDLSRVPQIIQLGRRTANNIRQNIFFSLLIIAVLVPAALFGAVQLLSGLLINEGAALLVILNGLRLLRFR